MDHSDGGEYTNDYSSYWQSIPDPPTPTFSSTYEAGDVLAKQKSTAPDGNVAVSRRCQRIASAPFRDLTNLSDFSLMKNNKEKPLYIPPLSSTVLSKQRVTKVNKSPQIDSRSKVIFSLMNDESDTAERNSDRCTSSHSLFLPLDTVNLDQVPLASDEASEIYTSFLSVNSNLCDGGNLKNDMDRLSHLVRTYCSLPCGKRANSAEANDIESISGYYLSGKTNTHQSNENYKQEFLLKAQSIVLEIDKQKQKDVLDTMCATECEGKKSPSGRYHYTDVKSLKQITYNEYRARYTTMIDQRRKARQKTRTRSKIIDFHRNILVNDRTRDDDSNMEIDDSVMVQDKSFTQFDSMKKISSYVCEESSDTSRVINNDRNHIKPLDKDKNEDFINMSHTCNANECNSQLKFCLAPRVYIDKSLSYDYRVIEARKKLWCAIDTALATYSQEIIVLNTAQEKTLFGTTARTRSFKS